LAVRLVFLVLDRRQSISGRHRFFKQRKSTRSAACSQTATRTMNLRGALVRFRFSNNAVAVRRQYSVAVAAVQQPVTNLEAAGLEPKHVAGQSFLHRLLGYQGQVLCSWNIPCNEESTVLYGIVREGIAHDMVTYLNEDGVLQCIRGIEYATESDLIASDDKPAPLIDLADKLLQHNGKWHQPTSLLTTFMGKDWFRPTTAFSKTTGDYCITGFPFYLGKCDGKYWWRCLMRIEHTKEHKTHFHAQTMKVITGKGDTHIQTKTMESGEHPLPPAGAVLHSAYHVALSCADGGYIWGETTLRRDDDQQLVVCQLPYIALKRP